MAHPQGEIVRRLHDGFTVAWDTTDVPDEVLREFRDAITRQVDMIVKVLDDDGGERVVALVECKETQGTQSPARRGRTSSSAGG
jgi:hypothetical protein